MSEARMMVRTKGWWREGGWIKGNGAGLWQCTQGLEAKRLIPREALHPVLIRRQFYERFERYPLCERERQGEGKEGGGGGGVEARARLGAACMENIGRCEGAPTLPTAFTLLIVRLAITRGNRCFLPILLSLLSSFLRQS